MKIHNFCVKENLHSMLFFFLVPLQYYQARYQEISNCVKLYINQLTKREKFGAVVEVEGTA